MVCPEYTYPPWIILMTLGFSVAAHQIYLTLPLRINRCDSDSAHPIIYVLISPPHLVSIYYLSSGFLQLVQICTAAYGSQAISQEWVISSASGEDWQGVSKLSMQPSCPTPIYDYGGKASPLQSHQHTCGCTVISQHPSTMAVVLNLCSDANLLNWLTWYIIQKQYILEWWNNCWTITYQSTS